MFYHDYLFRCEEEDVEMSTDAMLVLTKIGKFPNIIRLQSFLSVICIIILGFTAIPDTRNACFACAERAAAKFCIVK